MVLDIIDSIQKTISNKLDNYFAKFRTKVEKAVYSSVTRVNQLL